MNRCSRPPRAAERLLQVTSGTHERTEAMLGDLHEEFLRLADGSARRAVVWYWVHALRLSARCTAERAAARVRRDRPPRIAPVAGDSTVHTAILEARHAWRTLASRPGHTALIALTLALGLGANAAIFAMIDALIIHPFPFPQVERVGFVREASPTGTFNQETVSPANFLDWRQQTTAFETLVAMQWWNVNVIGSDEPEGVQGFRVSADFFRTLGVQTVIGRGFLPVEEEAGHARRAVIVQSLWQRRFGGDPAIVGRNIVLDGESYDVVGVAPLGFEFPNGTEVWVPLAFSPERATVRDRRSLTVIGRLRDGRSLADAQAEMAMIGERLRQRYPEANKDRTVRAVTLSRGMLGEGIGPVLALWQASALFVLLIACANVVSLLVAQGAERQREVAIRVALGASRGRIVRELLLESVALGALALPGAMLAATTAVSLLRAAMPATIIRFLPGWNAMAIDGRSLAATTVLALIAAAVVGLLPALQVARPAVVDALKEGGRSATAGRGRHRLRRGLVIAEIALAAPLLVASAMGAIGAYRFLNGPQGYDPDHVLSFSASLPDAHYADPEARRRFTAKVVERLRALPGIELAAATNVRPSHPANVTRPIDVDGRPPADTSQQTLADYRAVTTDLFAALRIPLHQGRAFTIADREGSQPVAIVSRSLANRSWPNGDAIGRRLRVADGPWLTVVGVCGDVIQDWFLDRNRATVYVPYPQAPTGTLTFMLRTAGDPAAVAAQARLAIRAVDPTQPVFDVMTMREALKERTTGLQFIAAVMAVFGGLALVLAVVGTYSVMAQFVTQRRHEIGIRLALGATPGDVLRQTVRQTGWLTLLGVGAGCLFSILFARLIEAGLAGASTSDARIVSAVAAILGVAALGAGYIPARRAAAVDPIVALRE